MQLSPLNIITQSPFPLHTKRHPMNLSTGCPFIPAHSFLSKRCIFRLLPAITTCTWFRLLLTGTVFLLFLALLSSSKLQIFPFVIHLSINKLIFSIIDKHPQSGRFLFVFVLLLYAHKGSW